MKNQDLVEQNGEGIIKIGPFWPIYGRLKLNSYQARIGGVPTTLRTNIKLHSMS